MTNNTTAAQVIASTAGRFFICEFIKKDGSRRTLIGRVGVHRHVTGEGLRFDPAERRLATVWDAQAKSYRMIRLDTLLSLRCGGIQWRANANS